MIKVERKANPTGSENTVTKGNLMLRQVIIRGQRFNDCSVSDGETSELVSSADPRFKELFIALATY